MRQVRSRGEIISNLNRELKTGDVVTLKSKASGFLGASKVSEAEVSDEGDE
jgi:hypothetical protein